MYSTVSHSADAVIEQPDAAPAPAAGRQYLTFRLAGMEYALDFSRVQELRPYKSLERFASEGEIVNGVAAAHGVIMPIVDMRIAFGQRTPILEAETDVIILKLSSCVMGMVVDGVTDVVTLSAQQIRPIPGLNAGAGEAAAYLLGLGEVGGRRLILVDIDSLMSIRKNAEGARHAA